MSMNDPVTAARSALCKQPHSFEWWAYNRAHMNLVAENFWRYRRGEPIWKTIQPHHYAFLSEEKQP
jgi:hypothetical protein